MHYWHKYLPTLMLLLGIALSGSCGEDAAEGLASQICPEDNILTYENFGQIYMRNWCTGCHSSDLGADARQGAPSTVNLDTLESLRRSMDRIYLRSASGNNSMPPAGGPTTEESQRLAQWLACDAP